MIRSSAYKARGFEALTSWLAEPTLATQKPGCRRGLSYRAPRARESPAGRPNDGSRRGSCPAGPSCSRGCTFVGVTQFGVREREGDQPAATFSEPMSGASTQATLCRLRGPWITTSLPGVSAWAEQQIRRPAAMWIRRRHPSIRHRRRQRIQHATGTWIRHRCRSIRLRGR